MEIKCFICGTDDKGKSYVQCVHDGQQKLCCVRCLPMLIHGTGH